MSGSDRPNINDFHIVMKLSLMTSCGGGWKSLKPILVHKWSGFGCHFTALLLPFSSCGQTKAMMGNCDKSLFTITIKQKFQSSPSSLHHSVASSFATANGSATCKNWNESWSSWSSFSSWPIDISSLLFRKGGYIESYKIQLLHTLSAELAFCI